MRPRTNVVARATVLVVARAATNLPQPPMSPYRRIERGETDLVCSPQLWKVIGDRRGLATSAGRPFRCCRVGSHVDKEPCMAP